ncbi:50S ribosomal protein L11 methyltransferase [soil metagenome]
MREQARGAATMGCMDATELVTLLSPEGLRLLDSLPPYQTSTDVLRMVSTLRKQGHQPALVAAVLSQAKLRSKATAKFGPFAERMLFTEAGLEQATRLRVAALHAGRFRAAGITKVADLGCGIGGDAMALASLDLEVTAVERDEVTAAIAAYNLAPWPSATVLAGEAASTDLAGIEGVYLDPARRTEGHGQTSRITDPDDYSPSLDDAIELVGGRAAGIKLGPGLDRERIPAAAEAQWVSVDGQVVELGLWFGAAARPDIARSALVLSDAGTAELSAAADSADVEVRELGEYLFEPDGAVIRARLIGDLGRGIGAGMVSDGIAYLTADAPARSPFATCFRVLERFALDERVLKRELADREIGTLEIKKRGVDVDPATLRKRLSLRGGGSATLFLTRVAGRHTALLAERVVA